MMNSIEIGVGSQLIVNESLTMEERLKMINRSPRIMVGQGLFTESPYFYVKNSNKKNLEYEKLIDETVEPNQENDYVYGSYAVQLYLGLQKEKFDKFLIKKRKENKLNFFKVSDRKKSFAFEKNIFLLSELNLFRCTT